MALLPYLYDDILPSNRHHFGFGIHPDDLLISPVERSLMRSLPKINNQILRAALTNLDGAEKKSHIGKDGFQVSLDVQHFSPNEITVKTVDNSIIVEAKHEERQDEHGYISRQFTRRYDLPKEFKTEDVVSSISSDGVLTIKAPHVKPALEGSNVRHVQIQQTGPARLSVKQNDEKADEKKPKSKK